MNCPAPLAVTHARGTLRPVSSRRMMCGAALLLWVSQQALAQRTTRAHEQTVAREFLDSVPAWLAQSHVPGLALAVLEHRQVAVVRVYGVSDGSRVLTRDALWNVASLTKPVVALTTLRLVDAKRLTLDAPLDRYWVDPDVRDKPQHRAITTRLVLSHQTGFPNWRWEMPDKKLGFLSDPGTQYHYSGEGFEYLRRALARLSGTSLQTLADSVLFAPLGMRETTFGWNTARPTSRFVPGHDTAGVLITATMRTMGEPNAADWLVTTIGDYASFGANVLRGAGLSRALYDEMLKPHAQLHGTSDDVMGLSWEILAGPATDTRILVHTGSDDGIKTLIVLLPDSGRGVVIFTNGDRGMDVALKILKGAFHLKALTP